MKKSYGKNEILHGISLDIEEGSIHGLVGRNGCGKTTLIKCLTGIYEQDQGQILVCGEEIFENPKVKAQVGYVADSKKILEAYDIVYLFLHEILKLEDKKAEEEAIKMKAVLEDETLNKLAIYAHKTLGLYELDCGYDINKERCINCLRRKERKVNE